MIDARSSNSERVIPKLINYKKIAEWLIETGFWISDIANVWYLLFNPNDRGCNSDIPYIRVFSNGIESLAIMNLSNILSNEPSVFKRVSCMKGFSLLMNSCYLSSNDIQSNSGKVLVTNKSGGEVRSIVKESKTYDPLLMQSGKPIDFDTYMLENDTGKAEILADICYRRIPNLLTGDEKELKLVKLLVGVIATLKVDVAAGLKVSDSFESFVKQRDEGILAIKSALSPYLAKSGKKITIQDAEIVQVLDSFSDE